MTNTRRFLAVTALSALVLGVSACSTKATEPGEGETSTQAPSASASSSAPSTQSGATAQSGQGPQSVAPSLGNQAPEVNVSDNESRCDLANLQPAVASKQEIGATTYVELTFTNEGPACWTSGFPHVSFSSGGTTVSDAVRDGEDPGNTYTIAQGGRVGVTLTAEAVDGVAGCTATETDQVAITDPNGSGSTSLRLSLSVCQEIASVAVSPFEPRA